MEGFWDVSVFALYTEIRNGFPKLRETDFWEKSPVDSADTLVFKNFAKITASFTFCEINVLLHFMQKFKMAAKNGGKTIFGKSHQLTLGMP